MCSISERPRGSMKSTWTWTWTWIYHVLWGGDGPVALYAYVWTVHVGFCVCARVPDPVEVSPPRTVPHSATARETT